MEVKTKQIEVFLKKTKITKTLVNQFEHKNFLELGSYQIIGWCKPNDDKLVISYNEEKGLLCTSRYLYDLKIEEITSENRDDYTRFMLINNFDFEHEFEIKHYDKYAVSYGYRSYEIFDAKNEAEDFYSKCLEYQNKVEEIGQFYI